MTLTNLIPLAALVAVPALHAQLATIDGELTTAEKNYVLHCLAGSVDALIQNLTDPLPEEIPNLHIIVVERELKRNTVPLDGLSAAQVAFLEEERQIQRDAMKEMEGKDEAKQQEVFSALQQKLQDRVKDASPEILRICGVSDEFQSVVNEVQLDAKIREIMQPAEAAGPEDMNALREAVGKLKGLSAQLRELAKA